MLITINASALTMYAPDGRVAQVNSEDVQAWKDVGWYEEPVRVMYAPDGRWEYVVVSAVDAWVAVGWSTEPFKTMYAIDGRYEPVRESQVQAWKNVGWYEEPVQYMYAVDGRCEIVGKSQVQAWKNVGWYEEPVQYMYSKDGRCEIVAKSQVEAWKKVGWYPYPVKVEIINYNKIYSGILKTKLASEHSFEASFSLIYVDGDNIPELVYRDNGSHVAGAELFTINGTYGVSLGVFGEFGDLYYKHKANRFTSQYWGMGGEFISLYQIYNGKADEIISFSGYENSFSGENSYSVNKAEVSFSEYKNTRKTYGLGADFYEIKSSTGFCRAADVNKYKLSYENVYSVFGY